MHSYNLLFSFLILAGTFALLLLLLLVALLVKHKRVGKSATLSSLRNFILCFFCIILLYYMTAYQEIHMGIFQRGTIGRMAEFSLFIFLDYFWISFIRTHLAQAGKAKPIFDKVVNWILAGFLILYNINCIFFIEPDYYVSGLAPKIFVVGIEACCCLTESILIFVYMADAAKGKLEKQTKAFITVVSLLISGVILLSGVLTIRLVLGKMDYAIESFYYDPTPFIMILTALCTLAYLFRHDFSPIYFMEPETKELSDEMALKLLAQECHLSNREREISILIFKGDSYEDIAEQLFISKLTVKKHVHNMYEKLDVSKRMDLINLVRARKIQGSQK